jgi:hypothetical protein
MPRSALFVRQSQAYRDEVLLPSVRARVAVEQVPRPDWCRYVGDAGAIVGMHTLGASAPVKMLIERFGFTPDAVADVARERSPRPEVTGRPAMRATDKLHELGPCLWLNDMIRELIDSGQLRTDIDDDALTA